MTVTGSGLGDVSLWSSFRNFWLGFAFSGIGDAMTKTALVWYVFARTGSAVDVGLLLLAYAGPVVLGGLVAGHLLDRFDRRGVMVLDCLVRGAVVAVVGLRVLLASAVGLATVPGVLGTRVRDLVQPAGARTVSSRPPVHPTDPTPHNDSEIEGWWNA
jgi:MFS family permease